MTKPKYQAPSALPFALLGDATVYARQLGELAAAGLLELDELAAVLELGKSIHARVNAETDSALKEDYGE